MANRRRWAILATGTFAQGATCSFLYGIPMLVPALRSRDGLSLFHLYSPVALDLAALARLTAERTNGRCNPQPVLWIRLRDAIEGRVRPGSVRQYSGRLVAGRLSSSAKTKLGIDDGTLQEWQKK